MLQKETVKFNDLDDEQKAEFINQMYENYDMDSLYELFFEYMTEQYEKHNDELENDIDNYGIKITGVE